MMAQIGTLIWKNDVAALQNYVTAHRVALGDVTGAYIASVRAAGYTVDNDGNVTPPNAPPVLIVPTNPPSLPADGSNVPWFNSPDGQINKTVSEGDGRASCTDESGAAPNWISTDPTFPEVEGITSRGAGQSGFVNVTAGQAFYFKQTSGTTKQMRASIS